MNPSGKPLKGVFSVGKKRREGTFPLRKNFPFKSTLKLNY